MPELPEVEAVSRRLQEQAAGRTIVAARFAHPRVTRPEPPLRVARRLKNKKILRVTRRAKNILIHLADGNLLRVHLGMTGDLYVADSAKSSGATRARFSLDDGREIIFNDFRLFGRINLIAPEELEEFERGYGLEPLSKDFTSAWLKEHAARSRKPAKMFLMDQTHIAGLGNIWSAEALFEARISPKRAMNSLSAAKIRALHAAIPKVLRHASENAYRYYSVPGETAENEGFDVTVYGRAGEPCLRCGRRIARIVQGGRSTFFCPNCQR